jgi:hypothetical protein
MKRNEYQNMMDKLRTQHTDPGTVSEIITSLSADYEIEQTSREAAEIKAAQLAEENKNLQKANLTLLVKFGVTANKQQDAAGSFKTDDDEPDLTFEALFDAEGNLK